MKYLFSDILKWGYFSRIWLWQRPKYYYVDKKSTKAIKDPFLLVSNHQGFADIVLLYYPFFKRRIWFLAHQNLYENRLKAWIYRNCMCVPIDPESGSFASLRTILDVIRKGNNISVYPEGHINFKSTQIMEFKAGATFIALQSGTNIVQFYRERRKHWWQRQRIVVGTPYNLKELCGGAASRSDLDKANKILLDKEIELKRLYQEIVPAKKTQRSNAQVFISPFPFECNNKIAPKQRKLEIESCKSEKTRNEKFYAWKLLEKVFKEEYGENIARLKFKKQDNGKWVCKKYRVSISHSGELVAVAISKNRVGIDIQSIEQVNLSQGLIEKVFLEEEKKEHIDEYEFSRVWGIKESMFKMGEDNGFNPLNYNTNIVKNYETKILTYNGKDYNLSVTDEVGDMISYHLLTPDIVIK